MINKKLLVIPSIYLIFNIISFEYIKYERKRKKLNNYNPICS